MKWLKLRPMKMNKNRNFYKTWKKSVINNKHIIHFIKMLRKTPKIFDSNLSNDGFDSDNDDL